MIANILIKPGDNPAGIHSTMSKVIYGYKLNSAHGLDILVAMGEYDKFFQFDDSLAKANHSDEDTDDDELEAHEKAFDDQSYSDLYVETFNNNININGQELSAVLIRDSYNFIIGVIPPQNTDVEGCTSFEPEFIADKIVMVNQLTIPGVRYLPKAQYHILP